MKNTALNSCSNCGTNNPINNRYCTVCGYELPKIEIETFNNSNTKLKHYNFEYADRRLIIKLLLITYALFFVLLFWFIFQYHVRTVYPLFIAAILITIFILWLNRKRIKLTGTASINEISFDLNLKDVNETIHFSNIKSHMIQVYQGITLKLQLNDGRKLRIDANTNFCNPEQFNLFCTDLEKTLHQFQLTHKVELTKEKSMFEKKWMLYLIIAMTAAIVLLVIFSLIIGRKPSLSIFVSGIAVATLWVAYYTTKKEKRKIRN